MTLQNHKYYCKDCDELINWYTALYRGGRCRSCSTKHHWKTGKLKKGKNHPSYKDGRCSKKHYCIECEKSLSNYRSTRCHSCESKQRTGIFSNSWKNGLGVTPLIHNIRNCFKYRLWRSDVFTRDNFTCQECGQHGGNLNAHHCPKRFSEIFYDNNIKTMEEALNCEEFWNINNGKTLCEKCHDKIKEVKSKKKEGDKYGSNYCIK